MAESYLVVTPGTGLNLRTNTRSISAVTVHEQATVRGEGSLATYSAIAIDQAIATSAAHLLIIQGDGNNYVRIRRITMRQSTLAGAAEPAVPAARPQPSAAPAHQWVLPVFSKSCEFFCFNPKHPSMMTGVLL